LFTYPKSLKRVSFSLFRDLIAVLALALTLTACAATPNPDPEVDRFAAPEGKGRLVFYRTGVPFLIALEPQFVVNDRAVGRAIHDKVLVRDAFPGRYQVFMASDPGTVISFSLRSGEIKFIKAVIDFSLTGSRISVAEVEEITARQEIGDHPLQNAEN